jgi:four helix bundle protein
LKIVGTSAGYPVRCFMNAEDFKERTKRFAIRIIQFVELMPRSEVGDVLYRQLLRAGTSVGANYRSACRARSRAEFIAKMGVVEEECDESIYWMELLIGTGRVKPSTIGGLLKESDEILSLVVASLKTARSRK